MLFLVYIADGQNSRFLFDAPGNLLVQTSELVASPQILGQPQNQIVAPGELASFSVVVADTRGVGYNWFFKGAPIPGATHDALLITNVSATNEGQYFVTVSNTFGFFVASDIATLSIDSDGDGLPDSWEQSFFSGLSQTAGGDFDGDGISNLQEFLDGTNPTNAVSALYRITLLSDGGTVAVVPDQTTYTNGASVTLTAMASGAEPFHAWTGDVLTRSNTITLTMTNNKTVFAHFSPVTFAWINNANGDWNAASNWTPNLVPGSHDTVFIVIANNITVTLNTDADLADFTLGNGLMMPTLTGSGALTIRGNCLWKSGTMSGSGRTTIETGGALLVANPINVGLSRTLENGGTATWTGNGNIGMNGAVITNRVGASFEVTSPGAFNFEGGVPRFDNAGTFRKLSAGTTSFSGVSFNNYNLAQIQSGTLSLEGGGLNNGTVVVPPGTGLVLGSGTFTANTSSSITGAGQFSVNGATATLAGLINVSGTNTFSNGTANLTGNYICTNNTLIISGGIANFDGTGIISPATVNLSGGALGGANTVTVGTAMIWTGGNMNGSGRTVIPAGVALTIANPFTVGITRTLDNGGTTVWSGSGNIGPNGAVFTNRAGALFDVQNAASLSFVSGAGRFDNAGTFRKSVGGTIAFSGVSFNNYNLAQIQSGALFLEGGGLNNGTVDVPVGTSLILGSSTFTASASSSITGAGQFTVNGATATLAGLINVSGTNTFSNGTANLTGNYICTNNTLIISGGIANFDGTGIISPVIVNLSNGALGGANTVTVGSAMIWTHGLMNGTGRTVIPPGAALNINSPPNESLTLTTRTLENGGNVVWTGTGFLGLSGAVITNRAGAMFDVQNASSILFFGGSPRVDNGGTFRKSAGGTSSLGILFNNYGKVDIRSGIVSAGVGYFSSSNALLSCALGGMIAGTNFGQLQVAGAVTLNGGLSVDLLPGFTPATNDTFTVLTAGSRVGTFASFAYPANRVTMLMSSTPTSVFVRVTAVGSSPPAPLLLFPSISGSNLLLTWTAVSNLTYRVEFNPDLSPSHWTALPGDVTALGNTARKLEVLTPSNSFYRVRLLP